MTQQLTVNFSGINEYPLRCRMLVAGAAGVGKTHLGTFLPNPIYANFSAGLTTLARIGNVPYVTVLDEKTLHGLHLALDRSAEEREKLFGRPIDTLVIDTVDGMQRTLMESRLQREGRTETEVSDWGWIAQRLHKIFTKLSELDLHILILTHLKEVPVGDNTIFKPALGGAFADGVFEYVNHAAVLEAHTSVEGELLSVDAEAPEVQVQAREVVNRTLVTWPTFNYPWVHDKTNTFPPRFDVTPEVFSVISNHVADVNLTASSVVNIDPSTPPELETAAKEELNEQPVTEDRADDSPVPAPQEEVAEVTQDTFECADCSAVFDTKAWADLSKMRHGRTLCGKCFKTA